MKKRIMIGAALVLLLGGAAAAVLLAGSETADQIADALKGGSLTPMQTKLLDLNGDGKVSRADWLRAKVNALLPGEKQDKVLVSADTAKRLGRTVYHEDTRTLWCSLSASGCAFTFRGSECSFELVADSAYSGGEARAARYAVYVDGALQEDAQLTEPSRTVTVQGKDGRGDVRIVKLSESAQSAIGIRDLLVTRPADTPQDTPAVEPEAEKPHYIEFIGDSITCGYGVDGEYGKDVFKTANENAAKTYAFRAAELLNADYSMVCYSGHGILSGYTGNGTLNASQLVPKYYRAVGYSSAKLEGNQKIQQNLWDFKKQPDLIVINLGTNDASYTGTDNAKQKEFAGKYKDFLKELRELNPQAPILCSLGIMGQTLCDAITLAVSEYQKETGDKAVQTLRFDMQDQNADGVAVDWHPSEKTHQKAGQALADYVKQWLNW